MLKSCRPVLRSFTKMLYFSPPTVSAAYASNWLFGDTVKSALHSAAACQCIGPTMSLTLRQNERAWCTSSCTLSHETPLGLGDCNILHRP